MEKGDSEGKNLSLADLFRMFPDNETSEAWFIKNRWPDGIRCPKCDHDDINENSGHPNMPFRCRNRGCQKFFSVKTDSVMHSSKLSYQVWAIAVYVLTVKPKGVSSIQLHKELGITQKTAWHLAHRIRRTWEYDIDKFNGEIEVDETYIGGREKNKHSRKKLRAGRGAVGKTPVVGARERESGNVVAAPIEKTDLPTLTKFVEDTVTPKSAVYTDEHRGYNDLGWDYEHDRVVHSRGEYVKDGYIHTNGIESFWAVLKRGYHGTYHSMSKKHLHRYVNEFTGRQNANHLDVVEQMSAMVKRMGGLRLSFVDLTIQDRRCL